MASIKTIHERKYKITVSNGYRPDGRKICKAKTITVPDSVRSRGISQYVAHAAEEFERTVKNGFSEDGEHLNRLGLKQTHHLPTAGVLCDTSLPTLPVCLCQKTQQTDETTKSECFSGAGLGRRQPDSFL